MLKPWTSHSAHVNWSTDNPPSSRHRLPNQASSRPQKSWEEQILGPHVGTTAHDSLGGRFHARKPDDFRALGIFDMAGPTGNLVWWPPLIPSLRLLRSTRKQRVHQGCTV